MPNPLTGTYDAVVQVAPATVQRLLASLHQQHGTGKNLPSSPHLLIARIGDQPLAGALSGVRGTAWIQVGVPAVSLVTGSEEELDLECRIRARYLADPGTAPLPEFMVGKLEARFSVKQTVLGGVSGFEARASKNDAHIAVVESNLSAGELAKVNALARDLLRTRLDGFLDLPSDLATALPPVEGLVDGAGTEAIALGLSLSSGGGSFAGANVFVGADAFAIGVSKEYILSLIQPSLDALKATKPKFSITAKVGWVVTYAATATYTVVFDKAEASWSKGKIKIDIAGHAKTPAWWAPNVKSFGVSQSLIFQFDPLVPLLSVTPAGQPEVGVSVNGPFSGKAEKEARPSLRNRFISERDKALAQAQPMINQALAEIGRLRKLARRIDDGADLRLSTADLEREDGIVLRGWMALSPRRMPQLDFSPLPDGQGYSAFDSWIPGGWIEKFRWSWWREEDGWILSEGGPKVKKKISADRFLVRDETLPAVGKAPGGGVLGQLCLEIEGHRVDSSSGEIVPLTDTIELNPGIDCAFTSPLSPTIYFTEKPWIKLLLYDPDDGDWGDYFGHVSLGARLTQLTDRTNLLLQLMGAGDALPQLERLREGIETADRADASLMLLLLFPPIALERGGGELLEGLRNFQESLPGTIRVLASELEPASWMEGFELSAEDLPETAVRLLDAEGALAWRHDGPFEPDGLAEALREGLVAGEPAAAGLLRLHVGAGERAPDFSFAVEEARRMALRRFRGRPVSLAFARAGSAPSNRLLMRLDRECGSEDAPKVIAVIDGADEETVAAMRRELDLSLMTVADPDGRISGLYGVGFLPSLVHIDHDGTLASVRMGAGIEARLAGSTKKAGA